MYKRKKKTVKQRGNTSHGWGAKKKHRGAGHRGGRGNAGSGKRGDAKKPSYWKDMSYYGKRGFTSKVRNHMNTMNVSQLSSSAHLLVQKGKATLQNGVTTIDMNTLKIDKLLGTGIVTEKLAITVKHAAPRAIEKIQAAGGSVTVTEAPKEKKEKRAHVKK